MPGQNSGGVPYPLDSDPIADWPQILQSMVGTLRGMWRTSVLLSDGGAEPNSKAVTFPAGMFTTTPGVFLTHGTGAADTTTSNIWHSSLTAAGCTIEITRSTQTVIRVHVLVVG